MTTSLESRAREWYEAHRIAGTYDWSHLTRDDIVGIVSAYQAAEQRGSERMREHVAREFDTDGAINCRAAAACIRVLPIGEE